MITGEQPRLSVAVVCFEMARELPRTLQSLAPSYQGLRREDYEVIVVDNGSTKPPLAKEFEHLDLALRIEHTKNATQSPVPAINRALSLARGALVGAWIDGARLASPGLLRHALAASTLASDPVVATVGFHLGPDVQMRSVLAGYDQVAEDALLEGIAWPNDGYRLFEVSSFAGSSAGGWFAPIAESNALFLRRDTWVALGGYDPGFETPGGGYCNLDLFRRACDRVGTELFLLLGEGTFHQVHGGIATNRADAPRKSFRKEYVSLRGHSYSPPASRPTYVGQVPPASLRSIESSARVAARASTLSVAGREFSIELSSDALARVQNGVLKTRYREVPFFKSPFDVVLYLQLLGRLRPRTIIELGFKFGGSALWFADQQVAHGLPGRVVAVDLQPVGTVNDERIELHRGDVRALDKTLSERYLAQLPRPWLVVEDSAHTEDACLAVLEFFAPRLQSGEYLVIEDGVVASLPEARYRRFNEGPNRAIASFMERHPNVFEVDGTLCDHFGFNVTYNPNGWLQRL